MLALDRTGGGVPADAVDFLLDQQCSDGSFRLYQFGYMLSFDPFETVDTHTCDDPAEGDADATAFALQALLVVPSSPAVDRGDRRRGRLPARPAAAVRWLLRHRRGEQQHHRPGRRRAARAAGEAEAADAGAAFLAGLQSDACAELGAIAYDQTAFDAGIDADRGQWTRATAQGVLGLGLPAYGGIGTVAPVDAGLDAVSCPAAPAAAERSTRIGERRSSPAAR